MKYFLYCLCLSFAIAGCGDSQDPEYAAELFSRVQQEEYESWSRAPGCPRTKESSAPHGDTVDIWVNDTMADAAEESSLAEWPVGSIVAKNGYKDDELKYQAFMEKRDDGWFFLEVIDGDTKYSGQPDICLSCHTPATDYILAFPLPSE